MWVFYYWGTLGYIDNAKPCSSIRLSVWVQCSGGRKHISQTNKMILSDTTQGTSNHCFSSGSVQSKMSSLCVFPLPMPCRKAWRRVRRREVGCVCVWGVCVGYVCVCVLLPCVVFVGGNRRWPSSFALIYKLEKLNFWSQLFSVCGSDSRSALCAWLT